MSRRSEPDDDEDWNSEAEDWGADADNGDAEEPTIPCPYCREMIHEDSQRCPECGKYLSEEDQTQTSYPGWVIATALILLLIICSTWIF